MKKFRMIMAAGLASLMMFGGCARVSDLENRLDPEKAALIEKNESEARQTVGNYFASYKKGDLDALKKTMTEAEYKKYTGELDSSFIDIAKQAGLDEAAIENVEERIAAIFGNLVESWDVTDTKLEDDMTKAEVLVKVKGRRESRMDFDALSKKLEEYWAGARDQMINDHYDEFMNLYWTVGEEEAINQLAAAYIKDYFVGQYDVIESAVSEIPQEDDIAYKISLENKDGKWVIDDVLVGKNKKAEASDEKEADNHTEENE